jgi:hypothetical protein
VQSLIPRFVYSPPSHVCALPCEMRNGSILAETNQNDMATLPVMQDARRKDITSSPTSGTRAGYTSDISRPRNIHRTSNHSLGCATSRSAGFVIGARRVNQHWLGGFLTIARGKQRCFGCWLRQNLLRMQSAGACHVLAFAHMPGCIHSLYSIIPFLTLMLSWV